MTSSNVSNLLVQVKSINVEMQSTKTGPQNAALFEKTLKLAGTNADDSMATSSNVKETKPDLIEPNQTKQLATTTDKKPEMVDSKPEVKEDTSETVSKIEEAIEEVKEVIEEKLGVTEEDIEKVLEFLGFTVMDLFNPQNLSQVVAKLTGENDSITLVMSEEFKTILDTVNEISNQLFNETNKSFEELKEIFTSFTPEAEVVAEPQISEKITEGTESKDTVIFEEAVDETISVQPKMEVNEEKAEVSKETSVANTDSTEELTPIKPQISNEENKSSDNEMDDKQTFKFDVKEATKVETKPEIKPEGVVFAEPKFEVQFSVDKQIVSLPTGETVTSEEIVNQLVEQAKVLTNAESTTMEMTLNPEGLGKIFMQVTQRGDEITAKIFTENDAVKQALESQMATLKLEMNNSSTKVTSIEVSVGTHEFERNLEEDARNQRERQEQEHQSRKQTRGINLNSLDSLSGLMSDEEILIAQMMQDNGNSLDYKA
ncbi:flagellar hook-length control protein FliK [Pseudobutyrivibrio ruminis]|uniref:flagellar hook-length control protein FliK n=1 Tax=Pseudobutyrivibrio ruminis TaxID=46206 RepID=UPI0003FF99B8|nr:flagellar hook-length control protein FliK [Pseudobutyrivibrio ruminis]